MISELKCMKCRFHTNVTDVFNMLSLSLPSNDPMTVSGYMVPYLFSDIIQSFKFDSNEKLKYKDLLTGLQKSINQPVDVETYQMYFMLSSRIVGT